VFSRVLWRFTTKFAPLAHVFRCATVNRGETGKTGVDTPESWHSVCLTFGRDLVSNYFEEPRRPKRGMTLTNPSRKLDYNGF